MRKTRTKNPTKTKKSCYRRPQDLFTKIDNIEVLDGYTLEEYNIHEATGNFYKSVFPRVLFGELDLSTIAVVGKLTNVALVEERIINYIKFVPGVVRVVACGKAIANPDVPQPANQKIPSEKPFRSCITVEVMSPVNPDKIYKIKVFRNGTVQVPGIINTDKSDVIAPLKIAYSFLRKTLDRDDIEIEYIMATMENFSCIIQNPDLGIIIGALKNCMTREYRLQQIAITDMVEIYDRVRTKVDARNAFVFLKFYDRTPMPIKLPKRNEQKTSGLLIQINRYDSTDKKDLTIRTLTSGKITFNGGNSRIEVLSSYYWLNFVLSKYYEILVYDPTRQEPKLPASYAKVRYA